MRIGVATIQRGRSEHLQRQAEAVRAGSADDYVVVSMDETPPQVAGARVIRLPVRDPERLPLAAARNAAIAALHGTDLVVMLDVDCIPDPLMLGAYAAAAGAHPDGLLIGPVAYLPAGTPGPGRSLDAALRDTARRAPTKRPFPTVGSEREPRHELFWSLSFAARERTLAAIGGFDEAYVGYGAEDTDFGLRAARAGVPLVKIAGAWAYHQHHPSAVPPVQHLAAIVDNAHRFRTRWGRWPMQGWLQVFADRGLVSWNPDGDTLKLTAAAARASPQGTPRRPAGR